MANTLELMSRIMAGDILFSMTAWALCILSVILVSMTKRWSLKIRFAYLIFISLMLVLLAHHYLDAFQIWYNTPLAEPMQLHFN